MQANSYSPRMIADAFGILASAACALHCVLVPALIFAGAVLPTSLLADEGFHSAILLLIVPAALVAFSLGCQRHRDTGVLVLGAVGVIGIVLSGTVLHDVVGQVGERVATVLFAAILIAAHYRNFRLCRSVERDH